MAKEGFSPRWPDTLSPLDQLKRWLSQTTRRTKQWLNPLALFAPDHAPTADCF
jgi:hypothetical protein